MRSDDKASPFSPEGSASFQEMGDDAIVVNNEEEKDEEVEEESDLLLALSESSPSEAGSVVHEDDLSAPKEAESESEQELTVVQSEAVEEEKENEGTSSEDSRASVMQLQVRYVDIFIFTLIKFAADNRNSFRMKSFFFFLFFLQRN